MSLAADILKKYLYGDRPIPGNLASDQLIRPDTLATNPFINISAVDFMTSGGGRFALATQFDIVKKFFDTSNTLAPNTTYYLTGTTNNILTALGMNNDPINLKTVVNQAVWRDVTDDYAERSFVFANTEFQLNATSFSVDANGNRYINGLKITPNDDNFDFNGGSSISDFVNAFIEPASDPSGGAYDKTKVPNGIGRTVDIKFTDTNLIPTIVKYGEAAYSLDLDVMNAWTYIDWTLPLFASYYVGQGIGMYQSFWDSGITKFLDTEGRPILYGTVKADTLSAADIGVAFSGKAEILTNLIDDIEEYESNGVVLIGGTGNDTLIGGLSNDWLDGGSDVDELTGGAGNDQFVLKTNGSIDAIADPELGDRIIYDNVTVTGKTENLDNGLYKLGNYVLTKQGQDLSITSKAGLTSGAIIKNFFTATYDSTKDYSNIGITIVGSDNDPSKNSFRTWLNKVSPIALDLNGDGIKGNPNTNRAIHFDMDNDGFAEETEWLSKDDGFLVRDANGNGKIDNQAEMFGDNNGTSAYAKLAALDTNQDGKINASDSGFSGLRIWQDLNSNGSTEVGELKTLASLNIASLSLKETDATTLGGLTIAGTSSFTRTDGTKGAAADLIFEVDQVNSIYVGSNTAVSPNIDLSTLYLPISRGYGNLPALHYAMTQNATLKALVSDFTNLNIATQFHEVYDRVNAIILEWAGATNIAPTGQLNDTNAQKIAVLTKFHGADLGNVASYTFIDNPYGQFFNTIATRLLVQGPLQKVFPDAVYDYSADSFKLSPAIVGVDTLKQEVTKILANAAIYAPTNNVDKAAFWNAVSWTIQQARAGDYFSAWTPVDMKNAIDQAAGFTTISSPVYTILDNQSFIYGTAGNDTLTGGLRSRIQGGQGNDYIDGGDHDTIIVNAGDGADVINGSRAAGAYSTSSLYFGNSITYSSLSITMSNGHINIAVPGGGSVLLLNSNFSLNDYIHTFSFADGTVKTLEQLNVDFYKGVGTAGKDMLFGSDANEALNGLAGDDTFWGSAGQDTINGGDGIDRVYYEKSSAGININLKLTTAQSGGDAAGDILINIENIIGTDFDDTFAGNAAANFFEGGLGNDTISYATSGAGVTVNLGLHYVPQVSAGDASGDVLNGIWNAIGSNFSDSLIGDEANNSLVGGMGDDTLRGGDTTSNRRDDTLIGGEGNDLLIGDYGSDILTGGLGNDTFAISSFATTTKISDFLRGADKIDLRDFGAISNFSSLTIAQSGSNAIVTAGSVNVTLVGVTASTLTASDFILNVPNGVTINGTSGHEVLVGTGGNDVITGLAGNDTITGGAGYDSISAGDGNDLIISGLNNDTIDGGAGIDTLSYEASAITSLFVDIGSGNPSAYSSGKPMLDIVTNVENVIGSSGSDNIAGNSSDNVLKGMGGSDSIYGLGGNDTLDGGAGVNWMFGGDGNDVLIAGTESTSMYGGNGNDIFAIAKSATWQSIGDFVKGEDKIDLRALTAINGTADMSFVQTIWNGGQDWDLILGGLAVRFSKFNTSTLTASDFIFSTPTQNVPTAGNDNLIGTAGNDTLDGGAGADTLAGGAGNDTYVVDNIDDVIIENANEGTDTVQSTVTYTLGNNLENLALTGSAAINGTGNALNNTLTGNGGDNILDGGAGNDAMLGGLGNDTYIVDSATDVITENASAGTDSVFSSVSYALSSNIENLTLTGSANINATGNMLNNTLTGNAGNNIFNGGTGNDTMLGGLGNDTYYVDSVLDVVTELTNQGADIIFSSVSYNLAGIHVETMTLTGTAAINATGNSLLNLLIGNSGNNILDGGTGTDTLVGGLGDDTYIVDVAADVINENADEGIDTVQTAINYTLGVNLENLTLTGSTAINGTGNVLNNVIIGNSANNIIGGGAGNDTLTGGAGADTFVVTTASTGVTITDFVRGTDRIDLMDFTTVTALSNLTLQQSATNTLVTIPHASGNIIVTLANITASTLTTSDFVMRSVAGNQTFVGTAGKDTITGGAGNDILRGLADNDVLNGGAGNDTLEGGAGDDLYFVDAAGDVVTENANEGTDTVQTTLSYTLGLNLENLILTGTAAINGTGNSLNNVITGNSGNNILDGGTGNDTLIGGLGNDTYIVDNVADIVTESFGAGTDTVISSVTYSLGDYLENLTLSGTSAINGTGGLLNNVIIGNAADNILNGGYGADTLTGGLGNDTYYVDAIGDVITENLNEGIDLVYSTISYTLTGNFENLVLMITAASGSGNALDNRIVGSDISNILDGGLGNDTMMGKVGDDTYMVDSLGDVVTEYSGEGTDTVISSVTYALGAHLENLTLNGTGTINGTGNAFNNVIIGNSANNILAGGVGNDTLTGGAGADTFVVTTASTGVTITDFVRGTDKIDLMDFTTVTALSNLTLQQSGANTLVAVPYASGSVIVTLVGITASTLTASDFVMRTATGNLALVGTAGNDTLTGGVGNDTLTGNAGNDSLIGSAGNDTLYGNDGDDTIEGGLGSDYIDGGAGSDYVSYATSTVWVNVDLGGNNHWNGDAAWDNIINVEHVTGSNFNDQIVGNALANTLWAGAGNDVVTGGAGGDRLVGREGNDSLYGGDDNDVLIGGAGSDYIDGGAGIDTLSYEGGTTWVSADLGANNFWNGDAAWDSVVNVENLTGTNFDDYLYGNALGNVINGAAGNDRITGNAGADTLTGSLGAELFAYNAITDSGIGAGNRDVIKDFTKTQGDRIDLSSFVGTFSFLGTGGFSGGANPQARYFDDGTNTIVQVDANGDLTADFEIQINGHVSLVSGDFVL